MSTSCWSASAAVPALPGAIASASTCGSARNASSRACSRAPEPITRTRTERHSSPAMQLLPSRRMRLEDFLQQHLEVFLLRGSETGQALGELGGQQDQTVLDRSMSGSGQQNAVTP